MVDTARSERRVRLEDGGRARCLHPTIRSAAHTGLHGRDLQAVAQGHPRAPADGAGKARGRDYEYERGGVANVFMFMEPLAGRRWIDITEHRTKGDWAHQIEELLDVRYPEAEKIVLVMDNLNTHTPASLYETFEPEEAKRLAEKLEIHYTPKHGSWLNMAEIELSVLSRQCLERRVPDFEALEREANAWQDRRDGAGITVDWRFSTDDARIKLKRLYPSFQE
jgi:transposase